MPSIPSRRSLFALAGTVGLAVALGAPGVAGAQDLARGEQLYNLCSQCHGERGEGSRLALAPALAGLPAWYVRNQLGKFYDGVRGAHPDDVAGMRMRPMALSIYDHDRDWGDQADGDDMDALAAYVASLPVVAPEPVLEGGDPAKGQQTYALCMACHGPKGMGNEALQSPPIATGTDWYMLTQLQNFKAGIRGADPRDASGATMRPMAMTLADEQAMRDVIAYILTLREEP